MQRCVDHTHAVWLVVHIWDVQRRLKGCALQWRWGGGLKFVMNLFAIQHIQLIKQIQIE